MKNLSRVSNPYGDGKVIDGCSIFGAMDTSGRRFSGTGVIKAIANMHFRGNGLGGGFAVYGLYPEFADCYAFHVMYIDAQAKDLTETFLKKNFHMEHAEEVPVRATPAVSSPPLVWRYFLNLVPGRMDGVSEEDYVVDAVMHINMGIDNAFVFSSGKDMAVFKGVGYPEEIAEYFRLEEYAGYLWTAHGRFPTNSHGWWGGAHPFNLLDLTVVHNGEISSYDTNRRFLEEFGYHCTMQTDTEVIAYAFDLLLRKHGLDVETAARALAPPFWDDIDRMAENDRAAVRMLRQVYGSLMLNGPFTIIVARHGEMIGLTDRVRLRPLTVGIKDTTLYLSSEESAIRLICPDLDRTYIPMGGQPVIGSLKHPIPVAEKPVSVCVG